MSAVVFVGPSLRPEDLDPYPHIRALPPVRQGDVYRAVQSGATAIGVVDGYFDGQPAVWHKEILWALAQGCTVFGAASMGALRAAELHGFGMRGVGRIFEDYRHEIRTDDDDVALVHGPAEVNYVALTEPVVNVDATLERAVNETVVTSDLAATIRQIAKSQFYQARTWASVLDAARETTCVQPFADWLKDGKVDRKRADALELLAALDDHLRSGEPAPPAAFSFEFTQSWADAPWRSDAGGRTDDDPEAILNELRLDPETYRTMRDGALLDWLAAAEIRRSGLETDRRTVRQVMHDFRAANGLFRKQDVADWAARNDSDLGHAQAMVEHHAALEDLARKLEGRLHPLILDRLRWSGVYQRLRERADRKASLEPVPDHGAMVGQATLLRWYFEERCDTDIPDDLDAYARSIGLTGVEDFHAILVAEFALCAFETDADELGAGGS